LLSFEQDSRGRRRSADKAKVSHRLRASKWTRFFAVLAASLAPLLAICAGAEAKSPLAVTRVVYAPGKIVPIPASIPHEEGDMVDKRVLPDLRWISQHYPIYVTDGYSGPLPNGEWAGCHGCHVTGSDHYNGLAVDIIPLGGGAKCDAAWAPITRLALWAEPVQNEPRAPFRWIGYEGDAGHGCGNHLHLSWNHAAAPRYELAEWVEVFPVTFSEIKQAKRGKKAAPKAPPGPSGGISQVSTGGLSPRGTGD
jgi:hypothetical protein